MPYKIYTYADPYGLRLDRRFFYTSFFLQANLNFLKIQVIWRRANMLTG